MREWNRGPMPDALRWSPSDMPDLTGRRALVTGATGGIGLAVALALARRGAVVVLAARDRERGERALSAVRAATRRARASVTALDPADLSSVRALGAREEERALPLDLLVC